MFDLVLIACSKTKAVERSPAGELYTSPLFRLSRAYAGRHGCRWAILSAEHGIVGPQRHLDPYDTKLTDLDAAGRDAWTRRCGLWFSLWLVDWRERTRPAAGTRPRVAVLAGRAYLEPLRSELAAAELVEPLAGMQIGERLQHLKLESEAAR